MFQIDIRSENFAFAGLFCTRWVEIFTGMCYNDELLEPVTSVSLYTALPVSDLYAFTVFLLQLLSIPFRGQKTHLTRYFSYFSYFKNVADVLFAPSRGRQRRRRKPYSLSAPLNWPTASPLSGCRTIYSP
jgi:hypothetical protein